MQWLFVARWPSSRRHRVNDRCGRVLVGRLLFPACICRQPSWLTFDNCFSGLGAAQDQCTGRSNRPIDRRCDCHARRCRGAGLRTYQRAYPRNAIAPWRVARSDQCAVKGPAHARPVEEQVVRHAAMSSCGGATTFGFHLSLRRGDLGFTSGLYRQMGVPGCIPKNPSRYNR